MAGLIVIDFIDMEQNSHVRKVEKAMKEALKNDRARIQVGRISSFGLMEMSRQRLRTGVLEASTKACPHCEGTGLMRTAASAGLSALRIIEDEAARGRGEKICLRAGREAAVYVLNKKRSELADIEQRYGVSIEVLIDESFEGAKMTVESSGPRPVAPARAPERTPIEEDLDEIEAIEDELDEEEEEGEQDDRPQARADEGERHGRRRRRRRRGGRGRRREGEAGAEGEAQSAESEREEPVAAGAEEHPAVAEADEAAPSRSRRRRRGRKGGALESAEGGETPETVEPDSSPMVERPIDEEPPIADTTPAEEPQPKRRRSRKAAATTAVEVAEPAPAEAPPAETAEQEAPPAKPARKRRAKVAATEEAAPAEPATAPEAPPVPAANNDEAVDENGEPRRGWWQRTFG
jgi:ribonuclease E